MWYTHFTVEESSSRIFPFDMLRYDSCYPTSQRDVSAIVSTTFPRREGEEKVRVTLSTKHEKKDDHVVTPGRWQSFGWRVVQVDRPGRVDL